MCKKKYIRDSVSVQQELAGSINIVGMGGGETGQRRAMVSGAKKGSRACVTRETREERDACNASGTVILFWYLKSDHEKRYLYIWIKERMESRKTVFLIVE